MNIFERFKLKRKIIKLEKKLYSEIYDEVITSEKTQLLISFNHKQVTVKKWVLGNKFEIISIIENIETKNLKKETYDNLKKLERLKKYLKIS